MRNRIQSTSNRAGRAVLTSAAFVGAVLALAGCSTEHAALVEPLAYDQDLRHPILLSDEPEVLDIPVGMRGPALSPQIETAIRTFAQGYRQSGTGSLAIQVPTASANEIAAATTGRAIHYALIRAGVPRRSIEIAPYYVGDQAKIAAVRLAYNRVKAVVPQCGLWPENGAFDRESRQAPNFGCAEQQNLVAMVANPADLIAPQPMTPANAARRAGTITTYAQTGNTGWAPSPKSDLIGASIGGDE